jgi:hypothetical protein
MLHRTSIANLIAQTQTEDLTCIVSAEAQQARSARFFHRALGCDAFLRHLYIKTNILPRQARDKHRENSKKDAVQCGVVAL